MEEWISQQQYMDRYKIGHKVMKQMIYNKQVEYMKTPGGQFKIKVGGDSVSRQLYEETLKRAVKAETKLENIQALLV